MANAYEPERGLPASLDAERSILGAIILNPTEMKRKETEVLTPDHFSLDAHRRIYAAMLWLWSNDKPVDMVSLCERLGNTREVETIGGVGYLSSLIDGVPERPHVGHYVEIVRTKAVARGIINVANLAITEALEHPDEAALVLTRLQQGVTDLTIETIPETELFVPWSKFRAHGHEEIDWLVEGVIEKGTNGFLLGLPKSRKSLSAVDLAVALASGTPWLDFKTRRRRVGVISREDFAGTTSRRLKRAMRGRDLDPELPWWDDVLWLNSRAEAQHLMLTDVRCLRTIIKNLKAHETEFLFLDVLKVLHDADENDSQEMGKVLKCVEQIHAEVGCQICIVHHSRKNWEPGMTLSEITRGSSVIAGFAEFLIGMRLVDEEAQVIQCKMETKADVSQRPIYWKVDNYEVTKSSRLIRTEWEPPKAVSKKYQPKLVKE